MVNHHFTVTNTKATPSFKLFELGFTTGVYNLTSSLTINGITVEPSLLYYGGDANGTNWVPVIGETLTANGSGGTFNVGSPLLGANDDSINHAGTRYYKGVSTTTGNLSTDDFVAEWIGTAKDEGSVIFGKRDASTAWELQANAAGSGNFQFVTFTTGGNVVVTGPSSIIEPDAWYHVIYFHDASGSAQIYVNTVAGTAQVASAHTAIDVADVFAIGARDDATVNYTGNTAYFAVWHSPGWLDTHLQTTVAVERFNRLIGIHPQKAAGTATPNIQTRASTAYLDKLEGSSRKLYLVGDNWMRFCKRQDSNNDTFTGFLCETSETNLCLQSEDLSTTWTPFDAGDTVGGSVATPKGSTSTTSGIIGDSTDGVHGFEQSLTLTAVEYCFSAFLKKGDQNWCILQYRNGSQRFVYFDLVNGVVGTTGTSILSSFIEDWGDGWFRCGIVFTATTSAILTSIFPAPADGAVTFAGDGATVNTYAWGMQVEAVDNRYATSYIPTTTTSATRSADRLQFKGDDGNLGGVGSNKSTAIWYELLTANLGASISTGKYPYWITDGGSTDDRIQDFTLNNGTFRTTVVAATVAQVNIDGSANITDNIIHRGQTLLAVNDARRYLDGVLDGTPDTSADIPDNLDQIEIGARTGSDGWTIGLLGNYRIYTKLIR